ncbi:10962_t:CDS:2, partial [Paraglomus occultum]
DAESLPDKDPPAGTTGDLSDPYLKIWVDGNAPVKTKPDKDSLDYDVTDHFYFLRYAGQQKHFGIAMLILLSATIDLKTVCQTTIGDDINAPAFCAKFIEKETAPYYTVIIYKYGD